MDARCGHLAKLSDVIFWRLLWAGEWRPRAVAGKAGRTLILVALSAAWAGAVAGCRATVVPPLDPSRPVAVYLIDYGRTSAVALPAEGSDGTGEGGRFVRYVYGDWDWYALRRTHFLNGVRVLFWPTSGALGRGDLFVPPSRDVEALRRALDVEQIFKLTVAQERAERLRRRLDAMYSQSTAAREWVDELELEFVPHPWRYALWRNSNHQTAAWLEELGCRVHGPRMFSRWRIKSEDSAE